MWILGILVYYLFYRVAIVYYMGMYTKGSLQRPVASIYRWFHVTVYVLSTILFITSILFFYLSDPWLTIVPVLLIVLSLIIFHMKQGRRLKDIIKKATEIQVRMERQGSPQTEINKAIYLGATGELYPFESEFDFKTFMKYSVLSQVIGFDVAADFVHSIENTGKPNYVSLSDKIDASVDYFCQYWRTLYDEMEKFKR